MLIWGNARPNAAANTKQYLARRKVELIKQSPYSPDLTGSCSENWNIYSGMKNSTPTRTSPRACSGSQTKWSKFGWQAFLWDAWVKYTTVSNPKSPKKHNNFYHFDLSTTIISKQPNTYIIHSAVHCSYALCLLNLKLKIKWVL